MTNDQIRLLTNQQILDLMLSQLAPDPIARQIVDHHVEAVGTYPFLSRIVIRNRPTPFSCRISKKFVTAPFVVFEIAPHDEWRPSPYDEEVAALFYSLSQCPLVKSPHLPRTVIGEFTFPAVDAHKMSFIFGFKLVKGLHDAGLL